jgi:D-tyrosyl-tRNA(Tyr) deacylase
MRAVVQRVSQARVSVAGETVGEIGPGLLVLLGVAQDDAAADADYVAGKIADLRLFDDADDKINLSLVETGGAALIVSQFTLMGDCRKGRRPSWSEAAEPDEARRWYEYVVERLRERGITVATGVFRAAMAVTLTNDGPVTVLLDSRRAF